MKNKILWYLFEGLFILSVSFFTWNVNVSADCVCPENDPGCKQCNYPGSTNPQDNWWWGCWEVSEWQYCCDGVVTNKPCDSGCDCSGITDSEAQYKCMQQCSEKGKKECPNWCCWIKLNTNFPFIGNCIWDSSNENETNAFPTMVWAITKIVMSLILVVCFILIIYAGILWASNKPTDAKKWLTRVAVTILLLWFSWAILRLINPNFFS